MVPPATVALGPSLFVAAGVLAIYPREHLRQCLYLLTAEGRSACNCVG